MIKFEEIHQDDTESTISAKRSSSFSTFFKISIGVEIFISVVILICINVLYFSTWNTNYYLRQNMKVAIWVPAQTMNSGAIERSLLYIVNNYEKFPFNYSFQVLTSQDFPDYLTLEQEVRYGRYWGAFAVHPNASSQLLPRILSPPGTDLSYLSSTSCSYWYDQVRAGPSLQYGLGSLGSSLTSTLNILLKQSLLPSLIPPTSSNNNNSITLNPLVIVRPISTQMINLHPIKRYGMFSVLGGGVMQLYFTAAFHAIGVVLVNTELHGLGVANKHLFYAMGRHRILGAFQLALWPVVIPWILGLGDDSISKNTNLFFSWWAFLWLSLCVLQNFIYHIGKLFGIALGYLICISMMFLMLSSCTFAIPFEGMHPFYQIGMFFPFYHIVQGQRSLIYSSQPNLLSQSIGVLFGWYLFFTLLLFFFVRYLNDRLHLKLYFEEGMMRNNNNNNNNNKKKKKKKIENENNLETDGESELKKDQIDEEEEVENSRDRERRRDKSHSSLMIEGQGQTNRNTHFYIEEQPNAIEDQQQLSTQMNQVDKEEEEEEKEEESSDFQLLMKWINENNQQPQHQQHTHEIIINNNTTTTTTSNNHNNNHNNQHQHLPPPPSSSSSQLTSDIEEGEGGRKNQIEMVSFSSSLGNNNHMNIKEEEEEKEEEKEEESKIDPTVSDGIGVYHPSIKAERHRYLLKTILLGLGLGILMFTQLIIVYSSVWHPIQYHKKIHLWMLNLDSSSYFNPNYSTRSSLLSAQLLDTVFSTISKTIAISKAFGFNIQVLTENDLLSSPSFVTSSMGNISYIHNCDLNCLVQKVNHHDSWGLFVMNIGAAQDLTNRLIYPSSLYPSTTHPSSFLSQQYSSTFSFIFDGSRGGSYVNAQIKLWSSTVNGALGAAVSTGIFQSLSTSTLSTFQISPLVSPTTFTSLNLHPVPSHLPSADGAITYAAIVSYLGAVVVFAVLQKSHLGLSQVIHISYIQRTCYFIVHLLISIFILPFWIVISFYWYGFPFTPLQFFQYWAFLWLGMCCFVSIYATLRHLLGEVPGTIFNIVLLSLSSSSSSGSMAMELLPPFFQIGYALPYYQIIVGSRYILFGSDVNSFYQAIGVMIAWVVGVCLLAVGLHIRQRMIHQMKEKSQAGLKRLEEEGRSCVEPNPEGVFDPSTSTSTQPFSSTSPPSSLQV